MAGSKDYAVLDLQNDSEGLGVDLQFQDFGDTRTQSAGLGGQHEQTITFSDFPDTPEEELEQEKVEPKSKRCKYEESALPISTTLCVEKVRVNAVLPEGFLGAAEFVQVAVLQMKNKKATSQAVKELSSKLPVPQLSHLKRVRKFARSKEGECQQYNDGDNNFAEDKLLVYLTFLEDFGVPNIEEIGAENLFHLNAAESNKVKTKLTESKVDMTLFTEEVFASRVAKYAPKIRDMYEKVSPYWPCSLHEDSYLVQLSSENIFSNDDLVNIVEFMNKAIELGHRTAKEDGLAVGVVIVNSTNNSVVGIGQDRRYKHPVQHAAMVAIDCVSSKQGGGAWSIHSAVLDHTGSESAVPLISRSRNCDKDDFIVNGNGDQFLHLTEKNNSSAIKECNSSLSEKEKSTIKGGESDGMAYICTGLDVYLSREPCMMCAMALLHSRVRRIFYCFPNSEFGALGSRTKLHTLPGINHKYEVFTVKSN